MPAKRLFRARAERLIGWARLVLAAGSILAVSLDPLQPAGSSNLTFGVLAGYLAVALIALPLGRWLHYPPWSGWCCTRPT
jgi:hypothetical protein